MPKMIVLDTHIWFWYINGSFDRFPSQWLEQIQLHKDPCDRLIMATALEYGAKLASIDRLFSRYPELEDHWL